MSDFSAPNWNWLALQHCSDKFLLSLYDWAAAEDWLSKARRKDFVDKIHACSNPIGPCESKTVWLEQFAAFEVVASRLHRLSYPYEKNRSEPVGLEQGSFTEVIADFGEAGLWLMEKEHLKKNSRIHDYSPRVR